MARDITGRLGRLTTRRTGMDRLDRLAEDAKLDFIVRAASMQETWQKRATSAPNTRYALGAMQEVGPDYTRISLETAGRVQGQLSAGLSAAGHGVDFRLQGSVPLNVHIRGVSDVDLLTLSTDFFVYDRHGPTSQAGFYTPSNRTSVSVLTDLRAGSEQILKAKYPSAKVDCSGGKAICISGGSLARPVDVVPSHWYNTADYQRSNQEHDRAVTILDRKVPITLDNWPFRHIKLINDRDAVTLGGLKKSIRLCKNVKSDAEAEGTTVDLPSFDIAATIYHANQIALAAGAGHELAILAETQRHLDWLTTHEDEAKKLRVPDGSRPIFNTPAKLAGLRALSIEMDDLLKEVAKEQNAALRLYPGGLAESHAAVAGSYIPMPVH